MQRVIGAVADGDLSKKVSADVRGEMLELKNTINAMVDQLNGFISEVTRVAREVGTEGKLGQAAAVTIEVGGVWKDLTDNVNLMAGNLTGQVRNIAEVTTAVANGDLSKKISIDVKGEFLELKNTVNAMVDQLNAFAGEVTRVAREVGVEGKLGGQAQSKEVGGVWKDLTDNVNQLAANLTNQVRAIAEVATAVTEGDLTRQVRVEASGEVAVLKDKLNEMIRNLRETTRQNIEQDWLKTNRERFTRMLQGQRDLAAVSSMILSELAPLVSAQHGVFYSMASLEDGGEPVLESRPATATRSASTSRPFRLGEGLVGQCAKEKKRILLTDVPGDYVKINSGLGESPPLNIIVLPVLFEGSVRAVVELASFCRFSVTHQAFLDSAHREHRPRPQHDRGQHAHRDPAQAVAVAGRGAPVAPAGAARVERGPRTPGEAARRAEHRGGAEEPGGRGVQAPGRGEGRAARRLVEVQVRVHRQHVARAAHAAEQPADPRRQLEDNPDENMTDTQVEYASVIHSSGNDLLGCSTASSTWPRSSRAPSRSRSASCSIAELQRRPRARVRAASPTQKGLGYSIDLAPDCPPTIVTDPQRLRQILKNLLANAFKFTEHGEVRVHVGLARERLEPGERRRSRAPPSVLAFAVTDTGIGIDGRAAAADLRGVRAGRRHDRAPLRRHRPRPLDQPRARRPARRRDHASAARRRGQHVHRLPPDGASAAPTAPPAPAVARDRPSPAATRSLSGSPTSRRTTPVAPRPSLTPHPAGAGLIGQEGPRGRRRLPQHLRADRAARTRPRRRHLAESGAEGVAILEATPDIDIVLMDIMMPVMDGYDDDPRHPQLTPTRRRCRSSPSPASAMAGERQRCLDAGANDYVPKPVDTAELLLVLGVAPVGPAAGEPPVVPG